MLAILAAMTKAAFFFLGLLFISLQAPAAVIHFYGNPQVEQKLFHVVIEYKSYIYEADTRLGGRRFPAEQLHKGGDYQFFVSDDFVNESALLDQMGRKFDYSFTWDNDKTYCSKLVGIALNMTPVPMSFVGTHYLKYYPDWIHRNDPGISLDQIYEFLQKSGRRLQ